MGLAGRGYGSRARRAAAETRRGRAEARRGGVSGDDGLGVGGEQAGGAEHGAGLVGGALAGDQVIAGGGQAADGAEVTLAAGRGVGREREDRAPQGAEAGRDQEHGEPAW